MKKFKNYLSLNLLSVTGYVFLLFCLIIVFVLFPQTKEFDILHNKFDPDAQYGLFSWTYRWFIITFLLELFLLLSAVIEFLFNKLDKNFIGSLQINIPTRLDMLHVVLFYFGLILAALPFVIFIITLF